MENLKNYEKFLVLENFKNIKSDRNTILYLEGRMTRKEYEMYCYESLNEGITEWWGDIKKWFAEKVISKIKAIYETIMNGLAGAYLKVKSIIDAIISSITAFKTKHPILFKVIITFIIVCMILIFMIITANSAKAGNPGGGETKSLPMMWDYANGLISNYSKDPSITIDKNLLMHAQAYCMDMKDGIAGNEGIDWTKENLPKIKEIVDLATKSFDSATQQALQGDKNAGSFIMQMVEQGKQFISVVHEHVSTLTGSVQKIGFVVK